MSSQEPSAMNWGVTPAAVPRVYQEYLVPGMFEALTTRVVSRLEISPGTRVLDVACGTGVLSRALARAGAEVTGLDLTAPMLAIAREYSPEIEFVEASADAIPFGDDSFDAATCQQGLQFFPNRQLALTQIRRVVKPGGTVVIACWCDPHQGGIGAVARALTKHAGEDVGAMMMAPFVINRESDLQALLEEVGFATSPSSARRSRPASPTPAGSASASSARARSPPDSWSSPRTYARPSKPTSRRTSRRCGMGMNWCFPCRR